MIIGGFVKSLLFPSSDRIHVVTSSSDFGEISANLSCLNLMMFSDLLKLTFFYGSIIVELTIVPSVMCATIID